MSTKRELLFSTTLSDCEIQTFTVGGPGGGGKDTSRTGVRLIHHPSGARGEGREERRLRPNMQAALRKLAKTSQYQAWARTKAARMVGVKTLDDILDDMMRPEHLRVEVFKGGRWVPYQEDERD